jgi:hypothetical protein
MSEATVEKSGEPPERPRSRRALLQAAGVAAGAVAASRLLAPEPAFAADGGNMVLGQANAATSATTLATSGAIANNGALSVTGANADYGVYGSGKSYGLTGVGPGGVLGLGTVGGVFSGSITAINLDPQATAGAPAGQAFRGDMAVDSTGVLWLCVAAGTPGTWIKVSHGGTRLLPTPSRAYDSRSVPAGKLQTGSGDTATPRAIPIVGVVAAVPPNAVGVVGNMTVTEAVAGGFGTIWPNGAWPGTSNINFVANVNLANAFTVGLSPGGTVSVAASAVTHMIIDITGYIL